MDADSQRAFDGAAATLKSAGAILVDVVLPAFDEATLRWVPLCGLEAALAHEATFPSRRAEYGPDLGRPDRSRPQPVRFSSSASFSLGVPR